MWEKIQTILIVTVVAVLIWLYAEAENVKQVERMIDIRFVAPQGRELIIEEARPNERIAMVVRGNSRQLARLAALRQPFDLEVEDDPTALVPRRDIDLLARLRSYEPLVELGISVLDVRPSSINIRVERYDTRELDVEVARVMDDLRIDVPPDPPKATLRLPASDMRRVPAGLRVQAVPDRARLNQLQPNVSHTLDVPLRMPIEIPDTHYASLTPQTVRVSLTILKTEMQATISAPVVVVAAPSALAEYAVEVDRSLIPVRISGPAETVEKIRNLSLDVRAELELTIDQIERGVGKETTVRPTIRRPADVTLVEPPDMVTFTIRRINEPPREAVPVPAPAPAPVPGAGG